MRLLPILMIVLTATLFMRMYDVGVQSSSLLISQSVAEQEAEKPSDEAAKPAKPAEPAKPEKPEEPAAKPDEHAATDEQTAPTAAPKIDLPATAPTEAEKCEFSQIQIDILQSLSKRREELEQNEKSMALKENILKATEMRIEEKIGEIKNLKTEVEGLLAQYNQKEQEKIRSLVTIYENMKPKDAARIFEELDMHVLLDVVSKMNERKLSPILATMNPTKAKEVTVELVKLRSLPELPNTDLAPAPPPAEPASNLP